MKATDCGGFGNSVGIETMLQFGEISKELDRFRTVERLERWDESFQFSLNTMKFEMFVGSECGSFVVKSVSLVRDGCEKRRKKVALGF